MENTRAPTRRIMPHDIVGPMGPAQATASCMGRQQDPAKAGNWILCWKAVHNLCPGPLGPINLALGRSGPEIGPWAIRARTLGPGHSGP